MTDNVIKFKKKTGHDRTVVLSLGTSTGGKLHLECVSAGLTPMEVLAMLEMAKNKVLEDMKK